MSLKRKLTGIYQDEPQANYETTMNKEEKLIIDVLASLSCSVGKRLYCLPNLAETLKAGRRILPTLQQNGLSCNDLIAFAD